MNKIKLKQESWQLPDNNDLNEDVSKEVKEDSKSKLY